MYPRGAQLVPVTAAALAASSQGTKTVALPRGFITLVGRGPLSGGKNAALRAKVELVAGDGLVLGTLWEGYVRAKGQPFSQPNLFVPDGWGVKLTVATSSAWAGTSNGAITFQVAVSPDPPTVAPWLFLEPPAEGSGPGDLTSLSLAAPGVNADYAEQTVPAQDRRRVTSFAAAPTTKTNAGSLIFQRKVDGTNIDQQVPASIEVGATGTNTITGIRNPVSPSPVTAITLATTRVLMGLGEDVLPPGAKFQLKRDNPAVTDEWNAAFMGVEVWAVIV